MKIHDFNGEKKHRRKREGIKANGDVDVDT